jgi:hypothetical protein
VGHKVAEAIIENGEITYVDTELPKGKITVRILYDTDERNAETDVMTLVRETAGLYKDIDADKEASKLRNDWDRNDRN